MEENTTVTTVTNVKASPTKDAFLEGQFYTAEEIFILSVFGIFWMGALLKLLCEVRKIGLIMPQPIFHIVSDFVQV